MLADFINKVIKTFLSPKFIMFCLLGIVNTFNAAFFSWVAHYIIQENAAAVAGYAVSLLINYLLNSRIIFKKPLNLKGFIRFGISYIPNFIIYFLVTFITINTLKMSQFWATVFAAMAGGPVTFIIIKVYAFGNRK